MNKVTVLGINGRIGNHTAKSFAAAGWEVTGFGRSNRHPIEGVRFAAGNSDSVADMRAAIGDSSVVVNALNPLYDEWDKGRMEAMHARVVEAMGKDGKTMLFVGNIYNYGPNNRIVTPDLPQQGTSGKALIRQRTEAMLAEAAARGDIQVLILRAGDFYGPDSQGDWFDQAMLREAGKGKLALMGDRGVGHSWAYLPDLGRAFEKLGWHRKEFGAFENFHFAGNFVTPEQMGAAITKAAPVPLKVSFFPRFVLGLMGLINSQMREVYKMRYLWEHPMELRDARLDTILGAGFGTPFDKAVAASIAEFFPAQALAA